MPLALPLDPFALPLEPLDPRALPLEPFALGGINGSKARLARRRANHSSSFPRPIVPQVMRLLIAQVVDRRRKHRHVLHALAASARRESSLCQQGFGVQGSGVQGSGFRVQDLGVGVQDLGFRV